MMTKLEIRQLDEILLSFSSGLHEYSNGRGKPDDWEIEKVKARQALSQLFSDYSKRERADELRNLANLYSQIPIPEQATLNRLKELNSDR